MLILKRSAISGAINSREIPVSRRALELWERGGILLQDAFPNISADDREFILSGITPEEWDEHFGED